MISVSSRGAIPLAIVVALMSIPVVYHGLTEPVSYRCLDPLALLNEPVLPDVVSHKTDSIEFGGRTGDQSGTLDLPGEWKTAPKFRLTRTFEHKRYYFVPRRTFTHPFPEDALETLVVEVDGVQLPLQLRVDETYGMAVTSVYFYVLGGRPIRNTFFGSLALAVPQALRGSLPLTLVLASGNSEFGEAAANRATLIDWAGRAWTAYDKVCNPQRNQLAGSTDP